MPARPMLVLSFCHQKQELCSQREIKYAHSIPSDGTTAGLIFIPNWPPEDHTVPPPGVRTGVPQTGVPHSSAPPPGSQTEQTLLGFHLSSLLKCHHLQQMSTTLMIAKFNYSDLQNLIMRARVNNYVCNLGPF